MRELDQTELSDVTGGVVPGPDGQGCTDPQPDTDGDKQNQAQQYLSVA